MGWERRAWSIQLSTSFYVIEITDSNENQKFENFPHLPNFTDVVAYKRCKVSGLRPQRHVIYSERGQDRTGKDGPGKDSGALDFKSVKLSTRAKSKFSSPETIFSFPTSLGLACRPDMALDVFYYKRFEVSGLRAQKSEIYPDRGKDKSGLGMTGVVNTWTYLLLSQ